MKSLIAVGLQMAQEMLSSLEISSGVIYISWISSALLSRILDFLRFQAFVDFLITNLSFDRK